MVKKHRPNPQDFYPDFGFDVRSTFLGVEDRTAKAGKVGKGVLETISLRKTGGSANGDIKLRFLKTKTYGSHSELLRAADYASGTQPIMDVSWDGSLFQIASRYTSVFSGNAQTNLSLMMASPDGRVEDQRGYEQIRYIVAAACGEAVLKEDFRQNPGRVEVVLDVTNDFMTPGPVDPIPYRGRDLAALDAKLKEY